jgi:MscS family membrane protein
MFGLNRSFLGNTIENYLWFLAIIFVGLVLQRILSRVLTKLMYKFLQKYSKGVSFESFLSLVKKPVGVCIILITLYIAFDQLAFPTEWKMAPKSRFGLKMVLHRGFLVMLIMSMTWVVLRIVDFFGLIFTYKASLTESKTDDQLIPFVKEFIKIIIAIFSVFFILGSVFNMNISSLIAGLGIGGLAIALAAKESLENLLGSFTIFLDKPFTIGDTVKIGSIQGTVERIGFRSTRIRTLEKTYVTVPNKKMVDSELDNLSLRNYFRVRFDLPLLLETSEENLKEILFQIRKHISEHPMIISETTVHFLDFGSYSLNLYLQYFVNTTDWEQFCKIKEEINLKIINIVRSNGSDLAYPMNKVRQEVLNP